MQGRTVRLGLLFGLYLSLSTPALAYLDPATGSIALQALIGAVGTWLVYSRSLLARAKSALKNISVRVTRQPRAK